MKKGIVLLFLAIALLTFQGNAQDTIVKGQLIFEGEIGVQAYSFRNYFPKDIPGTLDRIKAMGITELESGSGKLPPEEYKKLCDARGLTIPSTSASFEELRDNPMKVVENAQALGSKFVMCAWIPHEGQVFTIDNAKAAVEVFNSAGKVLQENDLTFCYHPHGYEFQKHDDKILLDYIFENTDPKYVSFEMDVFWIQFGGGDPVSLLKKYDQRWKMLHLKDMKIGTEKNLSGGANVENNVVLGTGELDMKGILTTAKDIGIKHYFIEDESSAVFSQVPKSVEYIKSLRY